jgi:hypothetical protein
MLCLLFKKISAKCFLQMAVAASNKNSSKPGLNYPELEEQALQFILDCCESNIAKYTKYLEVTSFSWHFLQNTLINLMILPFKNINLMRLEHCHSINFIVLWLVFLYTNIYDVDCQKNIAHPEYLLTMSVSGSIIFQGGNGSPQVSINAKQANRTLLLKQLAKDLCISERRILYRTQYVS